MYVHGQGYSASCASCNNNNANATYHMAGTSSSNGNGAQLTLRIILLCALAAAAAATSLRLVMHMDNPCAPSSLSRSILAATGLGRAYLHSCAGDDAYNNAPPLSSQLAGDDDDDDRNRTDGGAGRAARPIVIKLCVTGECCPPPSSSDPINFTFPDVTSPLRTRRPVHVVGAEYMAKYARAVALMKALPESDPRSFYQQANIHCAYCTGAHRQAGYPPELGVNIHFSWLFFPFHRAYLYFFERIAAKLLGDPDFTLPVWTWDVPAGMAIPDVFAADETSPLYDRHREPSHAPPRLVDLDDNKKDNLTDEQQIQLNLRIMHKQMVSAVPSLFFGQPYRAGDAAEPGAGTVELTPHNTMHSWVGDSTSPGHEDMGALYSSGRDPLFYPHHANIDRLWEAWRGISPGEHVDLSDPDWLDSSFLLYDEEARLVRVTVRDVLSAEKLGYTYGDDVDSLPWLDARPPTTPGVNGGGRVEESAAVRFPVSLDSAVTTEVKRAHRSGGTGSGRRQEEVLLVEGIEVDAMDLVRFDVYVNAREYHKVPPGGREMAGSFVTLKHSGNKEGMLLRTSMRVALKELLEDLGAQGNDSVTVTLVPVRGNVTIGGLRIVYMDE